MRIAVLSDVHANLAALEAVCSDLPTVDEVWVLGDIVGYGPQPNEVIATLQAMGARSVLGNHDGAAIGTVDASYFNPDARTAIEWTATAVDPNARAYLASLPEVRRVGDRTAVHGSPRDPSWEYITGPSVAAAHFGAGLSGNRSASTTCVSSRGSAFDSIAGSSARRSMRRSVARPLVSFTHAAPVVPAGRPVAFA